MIVAALVKVGKTVLLPATQNARYDLVFEDDGCFVRVQIKNGRYRDGSVQFNAYSTHHHRNGVNMRAYEGEVDFFGVYCAELDKTYLVPIEGLGKKPYLRVDEVNSQWASRSATDYEI